MEEAESQKPEPLLACPRDSRQMKDQKSNLHATSLDDAEYLWPKELGASGNSQASAKAGRNIPRRHTVGGPRSSREILGMQASDMDKKREAFLEHLKQKYPHHATAIMGHQERLRDQALQCMLVSLHSELDIQRYLMKIESSQRTRSPKLSQSPQPNLGDQAELSEASADSLEIMSEGESLSPFSRGSRTRASLPVVRSTNQTKERSLGVLYLQYGDETKQLRMPNEITSTDTIRALFVSAFPQQLTMKMLESPSVAIYIKDESRNIYYELSDVRNIQDRSFLKVYNKDPVHAFSHMPRAVNGDVRMQREIFPNSSRPGSTAHPPHALPISPPATPVPHSMPPSPSRIPYGIARPVGGPGNATIPRDRLSNMPASRSISPSPSAILERRDVKPDEDMGSKTLTPFRNEGLYADPYLYHEGRMSIAGSHAGHPLDVPDHIIAYHRSTMRSSSTYCNPPMQPEIMEQSLYRQKSRKYPDSHLPTLGSKTPPASPHRVADVRMVDFHAHHNSQVSPHTIHLERSSPGRQSLKKDPGTPVFVEAKPRNVMGLPGMAEVVPSVPDKKAFGYGSAVIPKENETRERMQAMEKQIASLTGLVQSALLKGPNTSNSKEASSEKMLKTVTSKSSAEKPGSAHVSSGKNSLLAIEAAPASVMPVGSTAMQVSLFDMKRNVSDLRLQLHQMRQLQLHNQEALRAMVKKAELEINGKVMERAKRLEDPVQRQRHLVEQERQKYLHEEEKIVKSLCELESFVEDLKKESLTANRIVTLKDVEDGAFLLRQVGEAVATLKGEFPTLQNKMRAILRIEVEAVRFLKEEPHKLDILLKRVRSMTDILTTLRRHVTDGLLKGVDPSQAAQYNAMEKATAAEVLKKQDEAAKSPASPKQKVGEPSAELSVRSEVIPVSSMTVHHAQSSPVVMHQSQHSTTLVSNAPNSPVAKSPSAGSSASCHLVPAMPESAAAAAAAVTATTQQTQAPQSPQVNGSTMQSLFIEELHSVSTRNRALSIEKAEKKWEEKRQNLDHYNGKEFEKLLEEAQANIMKSIPNLEMPPQATGSPKADAAEKIEVSEEAPNPEQETEKPVKSPPPPPPRRSYLIGSGLSTRLGEVSYVARKDSTLVKESSEDAAQGAQPKIPKEDHASPQPLGTIPPAKEEEEEEEGDRIMAELQAFQKCSYMDVNSNSHVEQSRNDTHTKDARPVALIHPKEKKVYGEATKDSDHPKHQTEEMVSDAPSIAENSTFSKDLLLENKEYAQTNSLKLKTNCSIVLDNERKTGPEEAQCPAVETGRQRSTNAALRETGHSSQQNEPLSGAGAPPVSQTDSYTQEASPKSLEEQEMSAGAYNQVVLRHKAPRNVALNSMDEVESPTSSPSDESPPSENIAFMITKTAVQFLSSGEVHDIVNRQGEDVQTVNIDSRREATSQQGTLENRESEEPVMCLDKKPVIIIFDEPMDIRSAYKRLSTIFEECDEELEKMMTEEKIDEEEEEEEDQEPETPGARNIGVTSADSNRSHGADDTSSSRFEQDFRKRYLSNSATQVKLLEGQETGEMDLRKSPYIYVPHPESKLDTPDTKKKFKFKFPKKQLVALTQAIRTGTKTGKKTLQVVVYEEEEEDGTVKQHKEAKRFEIPSSRPDDASGKEEPNLTVQTSRTEEIRKNTYRTLDSLEQTIKQLESTISEMSPKSVSEAPARSEGTSVPGFFSPKESLALEETIADVEPPSSIPSTSRKGSTSTSQTSRMPIPAAAKSRQQGSADKTSKPHKLQDQRQYRQANGSAKRAGGDCKATSPNLSASKIPAFSSTSGKSSSVSSGDSTNLPSPPTKASGPSSNPLSPPTGRPPHSASLIPSVSNGSLKFQNPAHTGKGHQPLSFSIQTQNGRPPPLPPAPFSSSSFSSPSSSSSSPPSLSQGSKSIRSIHTPSFTSYKSQNGSVSKPAQSSSVTKEST
ncbi:sickle tail protein homolog isoform X5 [Zootoca vivipara]|uniref:sickle tail protein homolog isoform X5 n=1 Tax=Zootoca vivipara TaxID=8524 RepID=UPI00293C00C1|nr:sickle tail protein homolog isoform X5 [Zootoca vivipara]